VDHPGACHMRAIRQGAERSATVSYGHSPAPDQDRHLRSSTHKSSDRTAKLVMRVRFPSPALAFSGCSVAGPHVQLGRAPVFWHFANTRFTRYQPIPDGLEDPQTIPDTFIDVAGIHDLQPASSVHLAKLTPDNVAEACRIKVKQGQEKFVAPVAESLAEAYVHRETAWPRLILDDDRVVGFIMGNFDPENEMSAFRAGIWRLNIQDLEQGRGYGRFAVAAVADEARVRGFSRITVLWVPGEDGPEGFYLKLGFRPTGEKIGGEIVGELQL
jgi:diamine N-acetyltransferase